MRLPYRGAHHRLAPDALRRSWPERPLNRFHRRSGSSASSGFQGNDTKLNRYPNVFRYGTKAPAAYSAQAKPDHDTRRGNCGITA